MERPTAGVAETDDLRLLKVDVATGFVISSSGRIERENDPDRSPGPRFFFAGCPGGNIARVRYDVEDQTAVRIVALAAEEPPWRDPDALPHCLENVIDLLSRETPVETVGPGVIFRLPNGLRYEHGARIVRGDTADGEQMLAGFAEKGLPQSLLNAGFVGIGDFWQPWCLALDGDEIASIAFAARVGEMGAEIGVVTLPGFRGRGFAAAVTASWSSLQCLNGRALFYSTQMTNHSSQRVAARLGLRVIGASVRIG